MIITYNISWQTVYRVTCSLLHQIVSQVTQDLHCLIHWMLLYFSLLLGHCYSHKISLTLLWFFKLYLVMSAAHTIQYDTSEMLNSTNCLPISYVLMLTATTLSSDFTHAGIFIHFFFIITFLDFHRIKQNKNNNKLSTSN